ncbi:hypothetical protein G3570_06715 [Balneolaceae bacterium YR4-1]|uniref:Uncharacterized protein n=1 Tax=Halalkalibaculum roseum TaxID=2709311 RepID=A0A6M1SW38_9BACT|nr:hypothetical protein [Halalkalibaculum roseum]NGP76316.1 hypothetical protein [Halalkalibaculum roseum]
MKKRILSTCFFLFFIVSFSFSQTERLDYKKIDYISVENGNDEEFLNAVKGAMSSAYQALIESGDIKSWQIYKVNFPGGHKSKYNYVNIVTTEDIRSFEDNFSSISSVFFVPNSYEGSGLNNLDEIVELQASEIWKVRSMISPENGNAVNPSRYMTMDFMDVAQGRGLEYLMLEDEVAMPLHKLRIDQDNMTGWEVYSLILPGGTEYGYNYATGNYFDHIEDIEFGFTQELIKQTMPGTDVADLLNTIYETRDLVKTEVWELVTYQQ